MKFVNVRGVLTAAAGVLSLLAGNPSAAWAQGQSPASPSSAHRAAVTAETPVRALFGPAPAMSGSAWIAQGTAATPSPDTPGAAGPAATTPRQDPALLHPDSLRELVGDMPVDSDLAPDVRCLAQAVYFESRGEPLDGQLAVAKVIMNRAASGHYPAGYCAVVAQPAQFSFVHHGHIPAADERSDAWRRAKAVAQIAQQNLWRSKAPDALYFHATYVRPSWARQKVQLAQIETHIFYR